VVFLAVVTAAQAQQLSASVGSTPSGPSMGSGFVGVSLEYGAVHAYTGRDPRAVDPILVGLLRGLAPGQSPVIRVGGDSADQTWWPIRGTVPPPGVQYSLTPGWLRTTKALAAATAARLIMGVNLAGGRPAVATAEARAFLHGIGRRYVQAFEVGNEPDLYPYVGWYHDRQGRARFARGSSYTVGAFTREFARWRAALPNLPLAGPAFAELTWLNGMSHFLATDPRLRLVTLHRYPLRAWLTDPTSPYSATIPNLLSDFSSSQLAQGVAPYVAMTHAAGHPFRIGEMNSAAGRGRYGVSNTFAAALWVLDTLFNFAAVGVDGVNVHSLPGAAYEFSTFSQSGRSWTAFVHPEYYGMLMFAQAFPPGAQLLHTSASPSGPVKVWATRDSSFHTRVVLINKDPANTYSVTLQVSGMSSSAQLERLLAPAVSSTDGVTLGGQSFGDETSTGVLPAPPQTETVTPTLGQYTITLPPASAAMLTQ